MTDQAIRSDRADITDPGDIGGYSIFAVDGEIGRVDKHDIEVGASRLLVTTGAWIFGKTVMLPAGAIDGIDHADRIVYVSRTRDEVKDAPEYDPKHP